MITYEVNVGADWAEAETVAGAMLAARTLAEDALGAGGDRRKLLPSVYALPSRSGRRLLSETLSDRAIHAARPALLGPHCPVCGSLWPGWQLTCHGCGAGTDDAVLAIWRTGQKL